MQTEADAYVARIIREVRDGVIEALRGQDDRPLLRYRGLAERLGVSERLARELLARGEIPSIVVSDGSTRVEPAAVDRYIASRREQADDDAE